MVEFFTPQQSITNEKLKCFNRSSIGLFRNSQRDIFPRDVILCNLKSPQISLLVYHKCHFFFIVLLTDNSREQFKKMMKRWNGNLWNIKWDERKIRISRHITLSLAHILMDHFPQCNYYGCGVEFFNHFQRTYLYNLLFSSYKL